MIVENTLQKNKISHLPMDLAEPSDDGSSSSSNSKCFYTFLQKLTLIMLLIFLSIGSYNFLTDFFNTNDDIQTTHLIIISKLNKTSHKPFTENIEIVLRGENKSIEKFSVLRKKRNIDFKSLEFKPKQSIIKFKDNKIQMARKAISEHHMLCNDKNHKEICKDLVTKLKSLTETDVTGQQNKIHLLDTPKSTISSNNNLYIKPIKGISDENDKTITNTKSMNTFNPHYNHYSHEGSLRELTDTCLLARLIKHSHDNNHDVLKKPKSTFDPGHPHAWYSNSFQTPYPQDLNMAQTRELHPQDVEIAMNLMKAEQEPQNKDVSTNISLSEIECQEGTVSCSNGDACVDEDQWCNGVVDCDDVSDELMCDCKSRVDKSRICDGYFDCPLGEDEMGCFGCDVNEFSCGDNSVITSPENMACFNKQQRCNNLADCPNNKDEMDCNMLAPRIHQDPLFAISNTAGFLHRNFKGDWYAVCTNPYMWAHDACRRETGLIVRPPLIQFVQVDPMLKLDYINTAPGGLIGTSNICLNSSAVYVTCPDLICGTRLPSTWQKLKKDNAENYLFGRNKRFLSKGRPYPVMFHGNRVKRYLTSKHLKPDVSLNYSAADINEFRGKRAEGRVVGGKPSQPAAWPWMTALYQNGKFHCGGVIINQDWIMSAAHCVHKFWNHYYEVQVGMLRRFSYSPQEQNHRVTHIIVNQNYDRSNMRNDLSLLKVDPGIQFSRWVRPVCLPSPEVAGRDWMSGPPPGTMCTAVGWGATVEQGPDPDHLREVEVPVWDHCTQIDDQAGNEICAGLLEGGKDSCQGDSGGPLLCQNPTNTDQWYVAGIVSHGDGCGRKNKPGVYTRVSIFVPWIRHHIFSKTLPSIQPKKECPGFRCNSGFFKCLPKKRMCDKIIDCLQGEDEINCESLRSNTQRENIEISNLFKTANVLDKNKNILSQNQTTSFQNITSNVTTISSISSSLYLHENEMQTTTTEWPSDSTSKIRVISSHKLTLQTDSSSSNFDFTHASTLELATSDSALDISTEQNSMEYNTEDPTYERIEQLGTPTQSSIDELTTARFTNVISDKEIYRDLINTEELLSSETLQTEIKSSKVLEVQNLSAMKNDTENSSTKLVIELLPLVPEKISQNKSTLEEVSDTQTLDNISHIQSVSFDNKHDLNKKIEKIMLSELHPAKIRKKHLTPNEFECRRILQTIPYKYRCDRKADCEDGTDELHCTCNDYLATFDKKLLCDGSFDCADGQDETDCFDCDEEQYFCKNSQMCVAAELVCDGKPHCPFGEDELDCLTLSNGKDVQYDLNGRPEVSLEGYLTNKQNNEWHISCVDNIPLSIQEESATYVCRYLGFSASNRFNIKYINIKNNATQITENEKNRVKREAKSKAGVQFIYINTDEDSNATKNIKFENPEVIKEQCIQKLTRTCMALYVYCDLSLFTDFDFSRKAITSRNVGNHNQMWPWVAKLYIDGTYKCFGILIDLSWALVSYSCLKKVVLHHHHLTVILGSQNTLQNSKGPFEQVYQVDAKREIYLSNVVLLHLKSPAKYSSMVKPMIVASLNDEENNDVCVALTQDRFNKTVNLFLKEVTDNCDSYNRCFVYETRDCEPGRVNEWSGIISCHSKQGWYPAASFVDNQCSDRGHIKARRIGNLKHEIKWFKERLKLDSENENLLDTCSGIRCGRGSCIDLHKTCNGVADCEDASDESKDACIKKNETCSIDPFYRGCECPVSQLKCRNGRCISKELFKDGKDDCGDGTDEPQRILCSDYLSRVMPSRLCDGILHCHDRSDEDPMFCKCFAKEAFNCGRGTNNEEYCVAKDMVCDGHRDCPNGNDERKCSGLHFPEGTPQGIGQVIICSHGVWFAKCYPKQNHTKTELEGICRDLGYLSGHAKQLEVLPKSMKHYSNSVIIDNFSDVVLNNRTSIKVRNTNLPRAHPTYEEKENCYPLFIECL